MVKQFWDLQKDNNLMESYNVTVLSKGASIYDARTEGGGGVSPKEDVVREVE